MSLVICADKPGLAHEFPTPSEEDIVHAIESLNNRERTGVILSLKSTILFIYGGNQDRVWLSFNERKPDGGRRSGTLADPNYTETDGEIDISIDGEVNPFPLDATVTKEVAIEVAVYFWEHSDVPHNLMWYGNID